MIELWLKCLEETMRSVFHMVKDDLGLFVDVVHDV